MTAQVRFLLQAKKQHQSSAAKVLLGVETARWWLLQEEHTEQRWGVCGGCDVHAES
jgi:hypothetical protein